MKHRSKERVSVLAFTLGLLGLNIVLRKHILNDSRRHDAAILQRALGEEHGRQQALDEVRMLAHGQLQAHLLALQHCLALAAAPQSESSDWIGNAQVQARLLHQHLLCLHAATSDTLCSTNLEQAVRDSAASLSLAYPACTCHVETLGFPSAQIEPAVQQAVLLVLYNALQNAYRHAHPSSIFVQLQHAPDAVILVIADDGGGFPVTQARTNGRGVRDMQHVVDQYGGTFTAESSPDSGTRITAVVPYGSPEQQGKGASRD